MSEESFNASNLLTTEEIFNELIRLRAALTKRWSLTSDQIGAIMASLSRLSSEARNAVLQELVSQEFYTEADMLTEFNWRDQELTDSSIFNWLLSEITEYRQTTVQYFQTLTQHMTGATKHHLFRSYLTHPYVVGAKMGVIWPWMARIIAFLPKGFLMDYTKTFVLEIHKEHTHLLSGTVANATPLLLFILTHLLNCKTKEELLAWRTRGQYRGIVAEIEIKADIMAKLAAKRDASPTRN